jgi:hypothetical protein
LHKFNQEEQSPKANKNKDKRSLLGYLTTGNPYSMKGQQEFGIASIVFINPSSAKHTPGN